LSVAGKDDAQHQANRQYTSFHSKFLFFSCKYRHFF